MKVRRCNFKVLFTSVWFFFFGLLLLFYLEHQRHFSNSFQHSSHLSVGMSSLCQFGSLWMGMFNLLTNSKLNESFNPLHHLSLQQQPGEIGKFKYLLIFHHFLPRFGYFPIGQTKKNHQYLYSNRRKFPNFREFHVIQSKKIRFNFSLYFQSYSLYSNFLRTLALCHSFSLIRRITAHLVNFSKKIHQVFRPTNRPHH